MLIRKLPYCNCDLNIVGISFDCLNNSIDYILICLETQTCLNSTSPFFDTIQSKTREYSRSHLVPSPEGLSYFPHICVTCFPLSNPAYFTSPIQRAIRASQLQSKQELFYPLGHHYHQSWSHSDPMLCPAALAWDTWMCLRREISYSNSAKHLDLAGKFHSALNSSDNWRIKVLFSAISPVWAFCLMLSNYLLFVCGVHSICSSCTCISMSCHTALTCTGRGSCAVSCTLSAPLHGSAVRAGWGCPELGVKEQGQQQQTAETV